MNLVTLITGIVIAMAAIELLLQGMPRMKRDLFNIAMLVSWLGFTSKYYYGPDILIYSSIYDTRWGLWDVIIGNYTGGYEIGYVFVNSLCTTCGISFYWMTAIISTLFFLAVYLVLRRLKDKRVLALAIVLVIMKDLIYAQLRQCLAVSFFIFAVLEAEGWRKSGCKGKKSIISAVILGLIAMTMHKSATFIVMLTVFYYVIQPYKMQKNTWSVLLMILLILMIIPTWNLIETMTEVLQLDQMTMDSIRLHLSYMKLRQTNVLVYGTALLLLTQYSRGQEKRGFAIASVSCGLIVIVMLYQYYFIVNRLRFYFAVLIVYYIFDQMRNAAETKAPYISLVRQTLEIAVILFLAGKIYSFDKTSRKEQGDLLEACTVLDLRDTDAKTLQKRQLDKAQKFWDSAQRYDDKNLIPKK